MIGLNAQEKIKKLPADRIAVDFLAGTSTATRDDAGRQIDRHLLAIPWHTVDHLQLVGVSLIAANFSRAGRVILWVAGIRQTIPSLALFFFVIPLPGTGAPPAIVALSISQSQFCPPIYYSI